ncbi:MAG: hypothetical protein AAF797_03085 [Planctomycetota bacterium]
MKLTDAGWQAWVYSAGDKRVHRGAAGYSELMRPKASQPGPLEAVAADVAEDAPDTGMLVNWNGGTFWPNPTLYHTSEFDLEASTKLTSVSWFQNNQGKTGGFRLALKIGPTWVVTDRNYVGYLNVKVAIADQKWRHLNPANLSIDAEATMSELPDGPIEAFGVYGLHTGYAELDNFTISVDKPQQ